MNIQSNISGSALEHDPLPLQNVFFFLIFSSGKHLSCLTHWSPALKAPSAPSFTKIQVVASDKTSKTERRQRHHRCSHCHRRRKRQREDGWLQSG
jgi:hypothetical protein